VNLHLQALGRLTGRQYLGDTLTAIRRHPARIDQIDSLLFLKHEIHRDPKGSPISVEHRVPISNLGDIVLSPVRHYILRGIVAAPADAILSG